MSEIRVNNLSIESSTGGPTISGITTFSGTNFFVPPVGNTQERPDNPQNWAIRFNTDTKHLEYFRGNTIGWSEVEVIESAPLGARGIFAGGNPNNSEIDYFTVATTGDAKDFGDLTTVRDVPAGLANLTRGIIAGGYLAPATINVIEYVTISTLSDSIDYGDLTDARRNRDGTADHSRGVMMSGYSTTAQIDYITITSKGDSIDFGDTTQSRYNPGCVSDPTRAVCCGGDNPSTNICDYITIQSTGDAKDFGDLTAASTASCAHGSSTRGIIGLGSNVINYITIASTGHAGDFGDCSIAGFNIIVSGSATSCFLAGGYSPCAVNTIEYVELPTLGNAQDFGDMRVTRNGGAAFSNSGGGV